MKKTKKKKESRKRNRKLKPGQEPQESQKQKTQTRTQIFFNETIVVPKKGVEQPALENALLIVGLPGIGLVSKMAVDHLSRLLHAECIASIYSPHFPNQVLSLRSGRLRPFSMSFYRARIGSRDIALLRGDLQPLTVEGQYEVTGKILDYARSLGVSEVIAMAGYALTKRVEKPAVYCASTSKKLLKKFEAIGARKTSGVVPIVGMAGLIPALARAYRMHGACLLVETPGNAIDARGAKTLLELLGKYCGKSFDTKDLEERARKAEKLLSKLESQAARARMLPAPAPAEPEPIKKDSLNYIR